MRETIETVPSDGNFVILEDDSRGSYAVARWSVKANDWIGENGEPITIVPTHWHPLAGDNNHPQEDNKLGLSSPLGASPSRRRRFRFFPFSASRAAPRRPATSNVVALKPTADAEQADAIETPTVPVKSKRAPRARRRIVALSLATIVVAALVATSFRTDVVAYLKHYAGRQDVVRTNTPDVPVASQTVQAAESATAELRQSLQQERDRAEALAQDLATARRELAKSTALASKADDDAARIKRAAESTATELRQSLQQERGKAEALAQDLATAQREIDKHTALASKAGDDAAQIKLAAESTTAELRQSLQQERGKAEALAQDLASAHREIDTHTALANKAATARHRSSWPRKAPRRSYDNPCNRSAARAEVLAQDLATAQREIEKHIALANKAGDDATQFKLAAESTTAELRQSLQQERGKAEALAQSLATAQREIDKHSALANKAVDDAAQIKLAAESTTAELRQSLQQERGKAEALAQDLATAQREIDKHTALATKAGDDAAQIKRAAESTTAELRQSLQQERGKAEALTQSLATAQREIDRHTALATKADDNAAQIKRVAESTTAELRQSLQQERGKAEALAKDLATSAPRDGNVRSAHRQGGRRRSKDQAGPGKHHGGVPTVLAAGARQGRGAGTGSRNGAPRDRQLRSAGRQGERRRGADQAGRGKHHRGAARVPGIRARQGRNAGKQGGRRRVHRSSGLQKAPRRSCDTPCSRSATRPRRWHRLSQERAARSTCTQRWRARRATTRHGSRPRKPPRRSCDSPCKRNATGPRRWRKVLYPPASWLLSAMRPSRRRSHR